MIEKDTKSLIKSLEDGSIDALFISISSSSIIVKQLMTNKNLKLFSFSKSYAYQKKYSFLSHVVLHEGVIDIFKTIPKEDLSLIASTTSIVTDKDTHKKVIRLFMSKLKQLHEKEGILTKAKDYPSALGVDMPINKYAKRYLEHGDTWMEKTFPFWIANHLDRLILFIIPLLTLLLPLLKGIIPLYRWSTRSKIYKWYKTLHQMNEKSYHLKDKVDLENDIELLNKLKKEVTEDVNVPLSYMGEYYNLQVHIEYVLQKLEQKKDF